MKALLLALTVMVSGPAFAGEFTSFGRILFQSASTFVPANKVCHADGMYYHTTKAAVAVEYCENDSRTNCKTVLKPLAQPMHSTREVCVATAGYDDKYCTATKTVAFNQGPTVKVEVYRSQDEAFDANRSPIRTGSYTIPACKVVDPVPAH